MMITRLLKAVEPDAMAMNTDWRQALGSRNNFSMEAELRDRMRMESVRMDESDKRQRNRRERRSGSIQVEKMGRVVQAA